MKTVTGTFPDRGSAVRAMQEIVSLGVPSDKINLLVPGATEKDMESIPADDGEQPGMGKTLGAVVGGAVGASAGLGLAPLVATILMPAIGPVLAVGAVGAAMFTTGVVGGAVAGEALEDALSEGLPRDEIFLYEDALTRGRTVMIVLAEDEAQADAARDEMKSAGAEEIDAARERWWIGLRDAEQAEYTKTGRNFEQDEAPYRTGFQAALDPHIRRMVREGRGEVLHTRYGTAADSEAFRSGYARGLRHREVLSRGERV